MSLQYVLLMETCQRGKCLVSHRAYTAHAEMRIASSPLRYMKLSGTCAGCWDRSSSPGFGGAHQIRPAAGNTRGKPGPGHSILYRSALPEMETVSHPSCWLHPFSQVSLMLDMALIWMLASHHWQSEKGAEQQHTGRNAIRCATQCTHRL